MVMPYSMVFSILLFWGGATILAFIVANLYLIGGDFRNACLKLNQ
jgi:hypothetical protein